MTGNIVSVNANDLMTIMRVANRGSFKRMEPTDEEKDAFRRLCAALRFDTGITQELLEKSISIVHNKVTS